MTDYPRPSAWSALTQPQTAVWRMKIGKTGRVTAKVLVSPAGLLAIGGLVSAILLSVPPIIRAAGEVRQARRLPANRE